MRRSVPEPVESNSLLGRRTRRAAAVALVAATGALLSACFPPPLPPAPDYTVCPAAGSGQVQVAVVVRGGYDTSPPVVCVVVPVGSDGLDALAARAVRIGQAAPRLGFGNAFVCGIDSYPGGTDCGSSGPDGFSYWNYWTGGTSWESADSGAGDRLVTQGSVDAWVYGTWDFTTTFPTPPADPATFAALTRS